MQDILIILVLYKVRLKESATFQALLKFQTDSNVELDVFVYDNSPETDGALESMKGMNCHYVSDVSNVGISKAYNAGATLAEKLKKKWVLLLDQDSALPDCFFSKLRESIQQFTGQVLFVPVLKQNGNIISPCRYVLEKGSTLKEITPGVNSFKNISIFNSGMCVSLEAWKRVGGYNEAIRLDFSDHYFISRLKEIYQSYVLIDAVVSHTLSSHTADKAIITRRFVQYCEGGRWYGYYTGKTTLVAFWTALRALKLTLQFREMYFLNLYYTHFFRYRIKNGK
ncbi:Glycosyltransferase, GT2 family [Filimonas lacunae]|uniref:Glycosyltransferase, GT2 family n=1 Tax=Filimonas lacunae TaxID=477680 RepID=A0A173MRC2_9BACT|nr:glycosyltransferase [Filimonas lacunae]BAV10203.1 glycosyl transferase, group 2 family protein [Filimonas lacunae]SIT18305.1 Glycosyltransferase, GT2 family [Filimonas lacunae]